jgi:hypothetical protein
MRAEIKGPQDTGLSGDPHPAAGRCVNWPTCPSGFKAGAINLGDLEGNPELSAMSGRPCKLKQLVNPTLLDPGPLSGGRGGPGSTGTPGVAP